MRVDEQVIGEVAVLSLSGDFLTGGPSVMLARMVRSLLERNVHHIVIDVRRVQYVDSGGLGALVEAFTAGRNRAGTVELSGVTRRLKDLLIATRLLVVFDCFDEQEVIEAIPKRAALH